MYQQDEIDLANVLSRKDDHHHFSKMSQIVPNSCKQRNLSFIRFADLQVAVLLEAKI